MYIAHEHTLFTALIDIDRNDHGKAHTGILGNLEHELWLHGHPVGWGLQMAT